MKHLLVAAMLALTLVACVDEDNYKTAPDPSWHNDRNQYCYWFMADPKGDSNGTQGWTDTKPEIVSNDSFVTIRVVDARIYRRYDPDYFLPAFEKTLNAGDGFIEVHENC